MRQDSTRESARDRADQTAQNSPDGRPTTPAIVSTSTSITRNRNRVWSHGPGRLRPIAVALSDVADLALVFSEQAR